MFVIITQLLLLLVSLVLCVDYLFVCLLGLLCWWFYYFTDVVVMELRDFNSYNLYTFRTAIKQLQTRNV